MSEIQSTKTYPKFRKEGICMKQTYTNPDVLIIPLSEEDILTLSTMDGAYGGETARWGSEIFF